MRIVLHGGFGEKGRTSIALESGGYRLLLDAGVKTSARGRADYYPAIAPADLAATDAILITHGHEDHVAALGWCLAGGFRGRILMTPVTRRDTALCLPGYAEPAHVALVEQAPIEPLPAPGGTLRLGPLDVAIGRSGHVAGGVWCLVDDGRVRFGYCGDVVPASPVFGMDPLPVCDALALDASYGDDDVAGSERARQIGAWIDAHPQGCVLPTPLHGRSLELVAIVPGRLALAPGMRDALCEQVEARTWLAEDAGQRLSRRIGDADDWRDGEPLPQAALLCHDGMGMAGPSRAILEQARMAGHPVLFTGHVPEGSAGARLLSESRAAWIRLPTHPTLAENRAMTRSSAARTVLGHSCEPAMLAALSRQLPCVRTDVATGDSLEL